MAKNDTQKIETADEGAIEIAVVIARDLRDEARGHGRNAATTFVTASITARGLSDMHALSR